MMSVPLMSHRQLAEQIAETKRIALAVRHAMPQENHPVLLVTSALQAEGKSLIAASIASALAHNGGRILEVDLNWHRPALHRSFALEPWFDFQDLSVAGAVTRLAKPSGVGRLDLLCAPRAAQDLANLNGNTLDFASSIIAQAREAYDFVVVDASSVFPTNRSMMDPVALASLCDGVALVVLSGCTPRQQIKRAQKVLEGSGAKILGVVMNQWNNKA